jgi:hypothetical protein
MRVDLQTTWRVVVDMDTGDVVPIDNGTAPPNDDAAVWHIRAWDYAAEQRLPLGIREVNEETRRATEQLMVQLGRDYVTGWENVLDQNGKPVEFRGEYMVNGVIDPTITTLLMKFLQDKWIERKQRQVGKAPSGRSRKRRSGSGAATKGRRPARRASSKGSKRA